MRFRSEKVPHGERQHVCDDACQITKNITDELYERVGTNYNADDLADKLPAALNKMEKKLGVLYH